MNSKKTIIMAVCLASAIVFAQNPTAGFQSVNPGNFRAIKEPAKGSGTSVVLGTAESPIPRQAWSIGINELPEVETKPTRPTLQNCGPYQGIPLGGFGTGGIGRSYRGSFGRWTVKAGAMKNFCLPVNMFSVRTQFDGEEPRATALHPGYPQQRPGNKPGKALTAWNWNYSGEGATCQALYPKAWYHYPANKELAVDLMCEQFSPVLPGQYRETSLPVGVFSWKITNPHDRPVEVSLMFSFANMVGWFNELGSDMPRNKNSGNCNRTVNNADCCGVVMERIGNSLPLEEGDGQFCIAAAPAGDRKITMRSTFPSNKDGGEIWQDFIMDGDLSEVSGYRAVAGEELGGALCVKVRLEPGETKSVPMVLSWDLPLISFGNGREHWRQYTRHFDRSGENAVTIATEALHQFPEWSQAIDRWHQKVIQKNPDMPDSFFAMLFNESYMAVDGLTVWTDGTKEKPGEDPFFAVIECPDYSYYCTLDLWIYGSFLFMHYWPELEKNVIRRFSEEVLREDNYLRRCMADGHLFRAKVFGAVPHDLGDPNDDPLFVVNSYTYQDSNKWKDLNSEFVLNVYRDVLFLNDDELLRETWPAVKAALQYLRKFDTDHDGLIENDGTPDQTMDTIPMKGPSTYCGGLWLGAVNAAVKMAERIGDDSFATEWRPIAAAAGRAFEEKLWNGTNYRLDADGESPDALYVDGMFGIWFAGLCGLNDLIPRDHYRAHLAKVYRRNFVEYGRNIGAINITGWKRPGSGKIEESNFGAINTQHNEVLFGLNLSFAGQLRDSGLKKEADTLLNCLYATAYGKYGLWFQSPAAWTEDAHFRAVLNLRPLVIWALINNIN